MITNIATVALIFSKYARSNPGYYFLMVVFFPLSLLAPLLILVDRELWSHVLVGSAVCSTTIMTISDVSDIISDDRYSRALSFFLTRPVRALEYIIGIGLSTLSYNFVGILVIVITGRILLGIKFGFVEIVGFIVVILSGWFISAVMGFTIGMWGPIEPRANTNLASIVGYGLTFLAPVYYPLSLLPSPLQWLSYGLYTTHLATIAKATVNGEPFPVINVALALVFLAVAAIVGARIARWTEL